MRKQVSVLALLLASTMAMPLSYAATKATATHTTTAHATNAPAAPATNDILSKADSDMMAVIDAQASLKPKPIEKLSAAEARKQPSAADGAKTVIANRGDNPNAALGVVTKDVMYKAAAGELPARVYKPEGAKADEKLPVIVYYHGGGFVIAHLDTYDSTPRALAKAAQAVVISFHYRQGPENKFPAAHDDAFAAYKWALANAAMFGGDASRVALVGESAGGNLAIDTAIAARNAKIQMPLHQVLVYPVAGVDMTTESYVDSANAKPLNKAMMAWFMKNYTKSDADKMDPRLDVIGKADLRGLPSTTIINAEIDPLRTDGALLEAKLKDAGVPVTRKLYEGAAHEFFGMGLVVSDALDANTVAVKDITASFDKADD